MERKEIEDRGRKLVVNHLGVEDKEVTDTANFIDDLGADSLDMVEMVMAMEEEFGVDIPDDEAEKLFVFNDAVDLIASKPDAR